MRKTEYLIILLLSINILLIGYFYFYHYKAPLTQCLEDPLVYGYKKLQSVNGYPLTCQCSIASPYPAPTLYFNEEGRRFTNPLTGADQTQNNFSSFNLSLFAQ